MRSAVTLPAMPRDLGEGDLCWCDRLPPGTESAPSRSRCNSVESCIRDTGESNGPRIYRWGRSMKLVIVDDEEVGRDSLKALLMACNFDVRTACNGPQALDLVERFHPDAVIIDWLLGRPMDGLAVAAALRESQPSLQIVIISGRSTLRQEAPPGAAYAFLLKPFQLGELMALFEDSPSDRSHRGPS